MRWRRRRSLQSGKGKAERGRWEGCRTKDLEVKRNTWQEVVVAARNTKRHEEKRDAAGGGSWKAEGRCERRFEQEEGREQRLSWVRSLALRSQCVERVRRGGRVQLRRETEATKKTKKGVAASGTVLLGDFGELTLGKF